MGVAFYILERQWHCGSIKILGGHYGGVDVRLAQPLVNTTRGEHAA